MELLEYNVSDLTPGIDPAASIPEPPTSYRIVLLLFSVPLITVTVLGNFLIILAWFTDSRVRSPSNAYLASLAVVDLLIGAIGVGIAVRYNYEGKWTMGVGTCQFWLICAHNLVFIGSVHLVLIAMDRHAIVTQGASYNQNRAYSGVIQCVVATWLVSIWIILPILTDWNNMSWDPEVKVHCLLQPSVIGVFYWMSLNVAFPGVLMLWIYTKIYFQMKRRWQIREMHKTNGGQSSIVRSPDGNTSSVSEVCKIDSISAQQKERTAFVTLGILIGIFFVCWAPYGMALLVGSFGVRVPMIYPMIFAILGWVNSAINPIVYAVRIPKYREAFKRILTAFYKFK